MNNIFTVRDLVSCKPGEMSPIVLDKILGEHERLCELERILKVKLFGGSVDDKAYDTDVYLEYSDVRELAVFMYDVVLPEEGIVLDKKIRRNGLYRSWRPYNEREDEVEVPF